MNTGRRSAVSRSPLLWLAVLWLLGCGSAPRPDPAPAEDRAAEQAASVAKEARSTAEAALGKTVEILANGDLALDGKQQILVANRAPSREAATSDDAGHPGMLVTRAAVLEKDGGRWSEIFVCDEHLKNPQGYLGGSPEARVNGWLLEFTLNAKAGLEIRLTPAGGRGAASSNPEQTSGRKNATFVVRWNRSAKRYETFDNSQERFLTEVPSLETPVSTLK